MLTFPNAKINLGLNILRKRPDGFHELESVFYPVDWVDVLEILPAETLHFQHSGIEIPGNDSDNLCLKAYQLLKNDFDIPFVQIHLHKVIPIGAGLGGGSSDAAFTLKLLNDLFELGLSVETLQNYARKLGSDCAFFIENQPKLCTGKGDVFEEIELDLADKFVVLVYPNLHISTAEAYKNVIPAIPEMRIKEILKEPISEWKNLLKNDFEKSLFLNFPILSQIKAKLYEAGVEYAAMSGSGSIIFGIFEKETDLKAIFPADFRLWQGKIMGK